MAGIATHGSASAPVTKNGHVTYSVYEYEIIENGYCDNHDPITNECLWYIDPIYGWVNKRQGNTGARITSTGVNSTKNVYVNSKSVSTIGDVLNENWIASPPVPSNTSTIQYRYISPGTSDNGQGNVSTGSSTLFINSKAVAKIGSQVTTCLGELTVITTGSSNVFTS
ncbi:PAAR domain-containing protein [Paenibacillus glucanolyticus]|uniref:PAAR domain-containing protein n=1 Tax=Paenibacillus sp. LBL TaxID=2940563 RepID=UPI0024771051|nr:PAAR domain-containing protein [Paenibacillus sp. LBL]MDH6671992.1 putative Zn-binding protein involved in type VI secretion [Paenibacillus sp. LBL]